MKKVFTIVLAVGVLFSMVGCGSSTGKDSAKSGPQGKPTLTLIGHASLKIKTAKGAVVYVDPYYQGDYSEKADVILVSHEHQDHNKIELCTQNEGCKVLRVKDTIKPDNSYNTFEYAGVKIEPVPAYNQRHPVSSTNGFVLTFDGITVYHASDTSKIPEMGNLKNRNIDYAFFPIDGQYNMGPAEAAECTRLVGAKHNTPFHVNNADVKAFTAENLLPVAYGQTIELTGQK
ncbi:MAG: MBL fold metallo-hydrolase [Firmicutes bacterium]|nr:MBL fold metallo-hydrolase [Bacillota bacterium]